MAVPTHLTFLSFLVSIFSVFPLPTRCRLSFPVLSKTMLVSYPSRCKFSVCTSVRAAAVGFIYRLDFLSCLVFSGSSLSDLLAVPRSCFPLRTFRTLKGLWLRRFSTECPTTRRWVLVVQLCSTVSGRTSRTSLAEAGVVSSQGYDTNGRYIGFIVGIINRARK